MEQSEYFKLIEVRGFKNTEIKEFTKIEIPKNLLNHI